MGECEAVGPGCEEGLVRRRIAIRDVLRFCSRSMFPRGGRGESGGRMRGAAGQSVQRPPWKRGGHGRPSAGILENVELPPAPPPSWSFFAVTSMIRRVFIYSRNLGVTVTLSFHHPLSLDCSSWPW